MTRLYLYPLIWIVGTAAQAQAGVVYHEVQDWPTPRGLFPEIVIHRYFTQGGDPPQFNPPQLIDFDGDGRAEVKIHFVAFGSVVKPEREGVEVYATPAGIQPDENWAAWNFWLGEKICDDFDEGSNWVSESGLGNGGMIIRGHAPNGRFDEPTRDFIGVRFKKDGGYHYGWILVDSPGKMWTSYAIYGWAYETGPDTPILAGDIGEPLEAADSPALPLYDIRIVRGDYYLGFQNDLMRGAGLGIESSEDLIQWTILGNLPPDLSPFLIPVGALSSSKFFRVACPEG